MENIIFWIFIFLEILYILVIIDVILSWITMIWLNIRPRFLADLINPIYIFVKKIIPTTIWPFDFTPIIILFWISFLKWLIIIFFPEIDWLLNIFKSI